MENQKHNKLANIIQIILIRINTTDLINYEAKSKIETTLRHYFLSTTFILKAIINRDSQKKKFTYSYDREEK